MFNRNQLQAWVDFANEIGAVILFDAAYEIFIEEENIPHSIYELDGADKCAIESAHFPKQQALPVHVSVIPLFLVILCAAV